MNELRDRILESTVDEVGIETDDHVWGVVWEFGLAQGAATVVSLSGGAASLYLSGGGGILGGEAHESVRQAVATFLEEANRTVEHSAPTEILPLPVKDQVRFYWLTKQGLAMAEDTPPALLEKDHPLHPLFIGANEVLAELRRVTTSGE